MRGKLHTASFKTNIYVRTAEQLIKATVGRAFFHICSSGEQIAAARNTQYLRGGGDGGAQFKCI
jgi:hypothetical protein